VAARHLTRRSVAVSVILLARGDELRGDAAINLRAARASGLEILEVTDSAAWGTAADALKDRSTVVLDALLGTGIRGGARGLAAEAIADLNSLREGLRVVSIDLPSGLDADGNDVEGAVVAAERTYTLCRPKPALIFPPGSAHAGDWRVLPIGIPDSAVAEEGALLEWLDAGAVRSLLTERPEESHKGTYGHLLALAGSPGKSGAAVLLGRAALRSGVGLLTVATAASSQERIAVQQVEIMTEGLPESAVGELDPAGLERALELSAKVDALAIGPGLGTAPGTRSLVRGLIERRRVPAVLDADGLNAFTGGSGEATLIAGGQPLVLTPHPGEAARLLGLSTSDVQADRIAAARTLAERTGATVLLKGFRSLIAEPDGRVAVNSSGNPGMATAGTGDVLTGAIGAFLAAGISGPDAARLAAYVHGVAGDLAAAARGPEGLVASDVVHRLPDAIRALSAEEDGNAW